jgi:nitrite reductase/ring-hydroxylating ferredoxin subunit
LNNLDSNRTVNATETFTSLTPFLPEAQASGRREAMNDSSLPDLAVMKSRSGARFERALSLAEVRSAGCKVARIEGHSILFVYHADRIFAVDNRCPHMGFPLDRGSVHDCILTCHWHHARFDLRTGGTFDPWADDVRVFPTEIRDGEIWVDVAPRTDVLPQARIRIREGLEQNISLVLAKSALTLLEGGEPPAIPFRAGLEFGVRYRRNGWSQGLTILTCMANLLPHLRAQDRPRALVHGLSAVASDCEGEAPRFGLRPLPDTSADPSLLKKWFRRFIEVRDAEGAERCLVSAVRGGCDAQELSGMLFAAATDHRYIEVGHVLDFINKAFEALNTAGWDLAEPVLASLASGLASADRMEESNSWRHPVDLVAILEDAFDKIPRTAEAGLDKSGSWHGRQALRTILLGEDPQAIADALLEALAAGASGEDLAATVAHGAACRIAHFHLSNEFGDWDTALHTFTFANAVHQGLQRAPSVELLRGVFDAAMSIYLDRFLNVPWISLPEPSGKKLDAAARWREFEDRLDRQQQVNEAAAIVVDSLHAGEDPAPMLAAIGKALLREDRNFHTIQAVEAAFRQHVLARDSDHRRDVMAAAARYLAAHAPTARAQAQTYRIAQRLHRGDRLYEEES